MIKKNRLPQFTLVAIVAMTMVLVSCQGRTADNMVPKGETVEVVIAPASDLEIDTSTNVQNLTDSLGNEN